MKKKARLLSYLLRLSYFLMMFSVVGCTGKIASDEKNTGSYELPKDIKLKPVFSKDSNYLLVVKKNTWLCGN